MSIPVLISAAQCTWREPDTSATPVDAMTAAANAALGQAHCRAIAKQIDAIVSVPLLGDAVPELAPLMPTRITASLRDALRMDAALYSAKVGGNQPQLLINRMAEKLHRGEHKAVLIAGGELFATLFAAFRGAGDISHWAQAGSEAATLLSGADIDCYPSEKAHGLFEPINVYPLIESALCHAQQHSPQQHARQIAALISRMSETAAANPYAWQQQVVSQAQVLNTDNGNRLISHPYTKIMNANPAVDMAAAVVMTTQERARSLGIADDNIIYLRGYADASDAPHFTQRQQFHRSPALRGAAQQAFDAARLTLDEMDHIDLYSCFPSAVQVACKELGLALDDPRGLSLTGGMTLFGGPGNNYSLHAVAELVQRLQQGDGQHGLITANGGYLTKHAVGVYSRQPATRWQPVDCTALQAKIEALDYPVVNHQPQGPAVVEAATVSCQKGVPSTGIVVGKLSNGERFVAHTQSDENSLQRLMRSDVVGCSGTVTAAEPVNCFVFDE